MYIEKDFLELGLDWLSEHDELKLCYVEEHDSRYNKVDEYKEFYGYQLFFTPIQMKEQWGDDWDDAPYDCNAGLPYDDTHKKLENGEWKHAEHTIYILQIYVNTEDAPTLPLDYGYNTPFSVDMINSGACAWMYFPGKERKACNGTAIHGGMSPMDVFKTIGKMLVKP